MSLARITQVTGRAVAVPGDDIDTDRIIPARFMKCITFDGLGQYAFYDERFDSLGQPKPHPLNVPGHAGAAILLSGSNFGCGSSREHAPQSLARFGIKAIIAESFAEIFFGNSTQIGLPCLVAKKEDIAELAEVVTAHPQTEVVVDVAVGEVRWLAPGVLGETIIPLVQSFPATQPASARDVLVQGRWDPIAELLDAGPAIDSTASRLPYVASLARA